MLERDGETAAVAAALAALAEGRGGVIVLEGPAGIGRSTLLRWLTEQAAAAGLPVLAGVGRELERAVEGGVRDGLLAPHGGHVPAGPHVLAVDDAQWVDAVSLAFVADRAPRAAGHPCLVAVAITAGETASSPETLRWLRAEPGHQVLRPAPLSRAAVRELARMRLGPAAEDTWGDLARLSAGNPLLLDALLAGEAPDGIPSPSLVDAVAVRLVRCGEGAQELAGATAVLGDHAALRHAAAIAELPLAQAEPLADRLVATGVLEPGEPLRFTAPLLAAAAEASLGPFARGALHRRAAAALADEGAGADAIARHLLHSTPAGDLAAVRALRAAAGDARDAGDATAAARLLERALAEPPDRAHRPEVLLELADTQLLAADPAAADRVEEALRLAADDPQQRLGALVARARLCQQRGDHAGADRAIQDVLDEAVVGDPAADALLADQLTATVLDARLRPHARARLDALLDEASAGHPPRHPGLAAHAALELALRGGPPSRVRELAAIALGGDPLVDPGSHGMLLGIVVQALACVDALDEAERAATAGVRAAADLGALIAASTASFHRAIPRLHRGALGAALADLRAARRASARGWSAGDPWIGALLAQVQLELGDLDAARAVLALADGVPEDTLGAPLAAVAHAQVALAGGEPRRALELAEAAGRTLEEGFGIAHPGLAPWRCVAALAARAAGDVARAEHLGREALARARAAGAPRSLGLALRTAAATGAPGHRVERLEEAVAVLETSPARLQQAHALVDLGAVLRRAGRRPAARSVLRDGLQLAAELGAVPLADRSREELRATGARPRRTAWTGAAALTPSERRVAELAAMGLTNDQIAQRLVVTAKTVQTHLTNAYRKLGITSRGELAAALAPR